MDVRVGLWRKLNAEELMLFLEKTLESHLDCKEIQPVHSKGDQSLGVLWKDWYWCWNSNALATWCEELIHLKRPWCWERLKAEGDDRGWDVWMASAMQWTWVWAGSGSWWWTGKPGMLQSMGLQSQTWLSDWTELNSQVFHRGMHRFLVVIMISHVPSPGRTFPRNRHWVPGSSPGGSRVIRRWGRSRRLWKNTYLITDIERLEMDSVVGRSVEKKRLNNLDYVK